MALSTADLQMSVMKANPMKDAKRSVIRDLASFHVATLLKSRSGRAITFAHRRQMNGEVARLVLADWKEHRNSPDGFRLKIAAPTYTEYRAAKGPLSSWLASIVIRWIVKKIVNWILDKYLDKHLPLEPAR